MKKLILAVFSVLSLVGFAQDRIDSAPAELSFKSQPIKKALYWEQYNGKWESRKASKIVFEGEGSKCQNFQTIFVGEYAERKYLFVEMIDYYWEYPNLEIGWSADKKIFAELLSEKDFSLLKNLPIDTVVVLTPLFSNYMWKSHRDYSFPFFLSLSETLLSAEESMYNSYLKTEGKSVADSYWRNKYPSVPFMIIKRVASKEGDVVRFRFDAITELIDACYFEVPYSEWMKLFLADKSNSYK